MYLLEPAISDAPSFSESVRHLLAQFVLRCRVDLRARAGQHVATVGRRGQVFDQIDQFEQRRAQLLEFPG